MVIVLTHCRNRIKHMLSNKLQSSPPFAPSPSGRNLGIGPVCVMLRTFPYLLSKGRGKSFTADSVLSEKLQMCRLPSFATAPPFSASLRLPSPPAHVSDL